MIYGEGVFCYFIVGYGGFQFVLEQNVCVYLLLCFFFGFYEEDVEWVVVVQVLLELFIVYECCLVDEMLCNYWFEVWEVIYGCVFQVGEFWEWDCQIFECQYVWDWIVIVVVSLDCFFGFVEMVVILGGKCGLGIECYGFFIFLVEYEFGLFGFVVDFVWY